MRWLKNGVEVSREDFTVDAADPGVTVGLNAFETLRTYGGVPFRAARHFERLRGSAQALGLAWPGDAVLDDELAAIVQGLPAELGIRVLLTAGGARLLQATPLDMSMVQKPLVVVTLPYEPPSWLDGRAKHGSRAISEVARRVHSVDEVFWVGRDGSLTEATRSSIFAVVDGVLVTPPDDGRILAGVTREALLEVALPLGIPIREGPIRPDAPFEELYASSTLKELAPVVRLDGRQLPQGGTIGQALVGAFRELVVRECSA